MGNITAENFYKEFIAKINEKDEEVKKKYYSESNQNELENYSEKKKGETPWTKFVNREIIPEIINKMINSKNDNRHKYVYQEFYKIDNTGWSYIDKGEDQLSQKFDKTDMNWHLWSLEIAVEHENDPKDWFYEVIKLLPFVCKLRVVIGYNSVQNRTESNDKSDEEKLKILLEQIKRLDEWEEKLKCGEFLIIIGNSSGEPNEDLGKMCGYKGYKIYMDNNKQVSYEEIKREN